MPSQSTDDLKLKERVQDICDRIAVGLPSPTGSGAIMQLITSYIDKKVREAHMQGWHEGRAAANNPDVKTEYVSSVKESED